MSYLNGKVAAAGLETEINGRADPLRWPCDTLHPQKMALTSLTGGGGSVGIVRLRTKAMEFSLVFNQDRGRTIRVEAGSSTSTVALRVVEGDEKGTWCLGVYKYGDLAIQVGRNSSLRH
jgi:hypothetical protein